jgi:HD-like signal output (HDOD) protein
MSSVVKRTEPVLTASESSEATGLARIVVLDADPPATRPLTKALVTDADHWSVVFVDKPEEALSELSASPADVLIADLSHRTVERQKLLADAKRRFPGVVRIAFIDRDQPDTGIDLLSIAHQAPPRPTRPEDVRELFARTCFLKTLMANQRLQEAVGDISALPAVPPIYSELTLALSKQAVDMKEVARIVGRDPAVTAKILQVVNSALMGLSRRISNVDEAVVYVGTNMIRHLVLLQEVFAAVEKRVDLGDLDLTALQQHSFLSASIASRLIPERSMANEAFTAALLHDIGELIFALKFPGKTKSIRATALEEGVGPHVVEHQQVGVTHAQLGAYLLGLWGLPFSVVQAVAFHHEPRKAGRGRFGVVGAVHVAEHLADEVGPFAAGRLAESEASMDLA